MFRANIYSLEPLSVDAREAIHESFDMVATYMGERAITKELQVSLPVTNLGNVDPRRVGFAKLDSLVELHLMALPLEIPGKENYGGLSSIGSKGWAFTDIKRDSKEVIRPITSHEIAHSLGFTIHASAQSDPESPNHCRDENCIMHKKLDITKVSVNSFETQTAKTFPYFKKSKPASPSSNTIYRVERQHDFCLPCKVDLREKGSEHLSQLRVGRLLNGGRIKNSSGYYFSDQRRKA